MQRSQKLPAAPQGHLRTQPASCRKLDDALASIMKGVLAVFPHLRCGLHEPWPWVSVQSQAPADPSLSATGTEPASEHLQQQAGMTFT